MVHSTLSHTCNLGLDLRFNEFVNRYAIELYFMKLYKIIGALLEGGLFAIFMWLGDKYLLDDDKAFYVYVAEAIFFAIAVYIYDRFFDKNK